jgi:hypothetical protein
MPSVVDGKFIDQLFVIACKSVRIRRFVSSDKLESCTSLASSWVFKKLSQANFGASQIDEDSDVAIQRATCLPNPGDNFRVFVGFSMCHVNSEHVNAGPNEFDEFILRSAGGTDRRNDFGAGTLW